MTVELQNIIDELKEETHHLANCGISTADLDKFITKLETNLSDGQINPIKKVKAFNRIVKRWGEPVTFKELSETKNVQWQNLDFYIVEDDD